MHNPGITRNKNRLIFKLSLILWILLSSLSLSSCSSSYYNFDYTPPNLAEYQIPSLTLTEESISPSLTYAAIQNQVTTDILSAHVRVTNVSYNYKFIFSKMNTFMGSGAIFYSSTDYYYALTNYHVVEQHRNFNHQIIKVKDYQNHDYDAFIYEGSASESLDLAIVVFAKNNMTLRSLKIRQTNVLLYTPIIAIGEPLGNRNVITTGIVLRYATSSITNQYDEVNVVPFQAIGHNANTDSGSSGGMLINYAFEIVGINFAKSISMTNPEGFAIPSETIISHLSNLFTIHHLYH